MFFVGLLPWKHTFKSKYKVRILGKQLLNVIVKAIQTKVQFIGRVVEVGVDPFDFVPVLLHITHTWRPDISVI